MNSTHIPSPCCTSKLILSLETTAGIDLGDAPKDLEAVSDQESLKDPEPAGAVASDGIDFGAVDFTIPDPVESGAGLAPGLEAPVAFSDALSELLIEEPSSGGARSCSSRSLQRRRRRTLSRRSRSAGASTGASHGWSGDGGAQPSFVSS